MFERLSRLGHEPFQRIVNELARGASAAMVARLIQQTWGLAQDVGEETLSRQLNRLRAAILDGAFGDDLSGEAKRSQRVRFTALEGSTFSALDALEEIAAIQWERVILLREKEIQTKRHIVGLNVVMRDYAKTLLTIQKIRFELGLDEYRFGLPPRETEGVKTPDPIDEQQKRDVEEAMRIVNEIFERRGIKMPVEQ